MTAALDEPAGEAWDAFTTGLPDEMTLEKLRDYVWVDNAQQRAEVLNAVRNGSAFPPTKRQRRN